MFFRHSSSSIPALEEPVTEIVGGQEKVPFLPDPGTPDPQSDSIGLGRTGSGQVGLSRSGVS